MVGSGTVGGRTRIAVPRPHEWLLILLGIALVVRYRWIIDDAFVYFRYVDNLLFLSMGLVFNAGEFVEGFSSPLQCVVLVLLRALEFEWHHIILGLGVACFLLFAALVVQLNREMAPHGPIFNLPLAVLAAGYGTTSYFTSGLETPLAHVVAVAVALWLVRPRGVLVTALVAVAPLARPELAIAVALAVAFGWWRSRRVPWLLLGFAALANSSWLAFRIYYYADLLPNTFYLKDGSKWARGSAYVADLLYGIPVLPIAAMLALLFVVALVAGVPRMHAPPLATRGGLAAARLAMLAIGAVVGTYVVRVGGAELHYWYLAFPYTLCVCASGGWVESYLTPLLRRGRWNSPLWSSAGALLVAAIVAADKPRQLSTHPFFGNERGERILMVADAAYHRHHPRLQPQSWREQVRIEDMRALRTDLALRGYRRIITGTLCRQHWALFHARVVHGFGLTEPILARVVTPELIPGHKPHLKELAEDLASLRRTGGVRPGLARDAVNRDAAPEWIARNLESIELIERKMSNRHDWRENVELAFTFPAPIVLPD